MNQYTIKDPYAHARELSKTNSRMQYSLDKAIHMGAVDPNMYRGTKEAQRANDAEILACMKMELCEIHEMSATKKITAFDGFETGVQHTYNAFIRDKYSVLGL